MIVLDASAVLVLVEDEPGADRVERALAEEPVISAGNLAEVLGKAADRGLDVAQQADLLGALRIRVEDVTAEDARRSALLRATDDPGARALSLGDRLCLALGWRLGAAVLTADRAWGGLDLPVEVELLR